MIFGSESISYYSRSNVLVWMTMAFQAGVLNIGGFMTCGRFVSHVTGFATFFGVEVSNRRFQHASGMLLVPLFFLAGTMLSGHLIDSRLRLRLRPKYYITFGMIFLLNVGILLGGLLGAFGAFGEALEHVRGYVLLAALCLVCGVQNGTITTVSKSAVRTTHLTGITTDLGIGIVRYLNRHKVSIDSSNELHGNTTRIGIILFFGLGSVVGGLAF